MYAVCVCAGKFPLHPVHATFGLSTPVRTSSITRAMATRRLPCKRGGVGVGVVVSEGETEVVSEGEREGGGIRLMAMTDGWCVCVCGGSEGDPKG